MASVQSRVAQSGLAECSTAKSPCTCSSSHLATSFSSGAGTRCIASRQRKATSPECSWSSPSTTNPTWPSPNRPCTRSRAAWAELEGRPRSAHGAKHDRQDTESWRPLDEEAVPTELPRSSRARTATARYRRHAPRAGPRRPGHRESPATQHLCADLLCRLSRERPKEDLKRSVAGIYVRLGAALPGALITSISSPMDIQAETRNGDIQVTYFNREDHYGTRNGGVFGAPSRCRGQHRGFPS